MGKLILVISVLALLLSIPAIVSAQSPVPPQKFYGVVIVGEGTAAEGTMVTAMIGASRVWGTSA